MLCSLKIAVCAPKIPRGRKKLKIPIRLKITIIYKNYGLKIPVRVRVYARIYARVYDCQDSIGHTTSTPTEHRTPTEKGGGKPAYICMITDNEKKYKKS